MPKGIYTRTKYDIETRKKAMKGNKLALGYKHTKETKRKVGEASKRRWANPGSSIGMRNKKHTKEVKARIRKSMKIIIKNRDDWNSWHKGNKYGEGHIPWSKGKTGVFSKETLEKMREIKKNKKHSEETKRKISKISFNYWAKFTKEEKRIITKNGRLAAQQANPSSIEITICKVLDNLNIEYETQVSFNRHKFVADIYVPNKNLIIECNGDYWHSLPNRIKRDKEFQEYCNKNNYKLIWLWESEINKNPKLALKNGLKKMIKGEK